nr:MAG TPA: hypothetical protein [Caudoviricetes sp.]
MLLRHIFSFCLSKILAFFQRLCNLLWLNSLQICLSKKASKIQAKW